MLQALVRNWLFGLLQKSSDSKSQALSIVSQQPPSQVISRKEDKYPHMNLCVVLVKDMRKQKPKLSIMTKSKVSRLTTLMLLTHNGEIERR